jgi:molecular chaperone DnaK (HSP70)
MQLGIDFGTTHTVVALVDRGNYPVVAFDGGDVFPSLVAGHKDGEVRFGPAAAAVQNLPGWSLMRSVKRLLNDARASSTVELAGHQHGLFDLLVGFISHLREQLFTASNAGLTRGEELEAAVSVPANASSAQRFLTMEAFRRAGFRVQAMLNEPSAAGFEYAHRYGRTITSRREHVLVYDLGGGTFDASLLKMAGRDNAVITSEGVPRLGGDDFDEAILELVLARLGGAAGPLELDPVRRGLLLDECRRQKEVLRPNTKRLVVDLGVLEMAPLALPVDEVYRVCLPLVQRSLEALAPVIARANQPETDGEGDEAAAAAAATAVPAAAVELGDVAGIYIVGGTGNFPLIPRLLKERFGEKRVKRSPHPFAATAMGLAIYLDQQAGFSLEERFSRTFGVFREADSGEDVVFDPIFAKDTPLPRPGEPPLRARRRYRARHNIGHFRFVECGRLESGRPDGHVTPWDDVRFPFDPRLRPAALESLGAAQVERWATDGHLVEEVYNCDASGQVEVVLRDVEDGFSRSFVLGRPGAPG